MTTSTFFRKIPARESAPAPVPAMTLTERRAVLDEIARVHAQHAANVQRSTARLAEADAQIARARDLLRDAETARAEIQCEALTASGQHGVTISLLEQRLRVGAPQILDVFISEIAAEEDAKRAALQTVERLGREVGGVRAPGAIMSNVESIKRRLAALRHARQAAEAMKLLAAIPEPELRAQLKKIRDEIPEVEPLLVDGPDLVTPAEARELQWRLEGSRA